MAKFIRKILLVTIEVILAFALVATIVPLATKNVYSDNYQKGFVYQYRRLQNAPADTDKLIIFGGSYLTFSLDTKLMEQLTGMPCYEMGVQSNMGMCYTIELIEDYINEGDIVVFPYEYFAKDDYGMDLIYTSIESEPDMMLSFAKDHPSELFNAVSRGTFRRVAGLFRNTNDPYYNAKYFDPEYAYYAMERPEPIVSEQDMIDAGYAHTMKEVDMTGIDRLNQLNALCEERGAKLYITYAPLCDLSIWTDKEGRDDFEKSMADVLDADIICSLDDCFYPYEYVFNGNMHLNTAGMEAYTTDLAQILKPYINN